VITQEQFVATVNQYLDLPVLSEASEQQMIASAVSSVWLYVPPFIWHVMASAADGISPRDLDAICNQIAELAADRIHWGPIPHSIRAAVIRQVVNVIREYSQVDRFLEFTSV
jgi:hypothetical protein